MKSTSKEVCRYLPYGVNIEIKLRPLSDLIVIITHNGKTFIPMLELYKIAQEETDEFENDEYKMKFESEIIVMLAHYVTKDKKHGWQFNYLIPQKTFSLVHSDTRDQETLKQFELMEKLFEWHFDVFELIDKGLANKL